MFLIRNAKLITMGEKDYPQGDIAIKAGKIVAVGVNLSLPGARVIDANGLTALPGLIDLHAHVGVSEEGMRDEGEDCNEESDPLTPELRAIDAVNPFDPGFAEAAAQGVTTVMTGPGSANVLGGQFALMKTAGRDVEDMTLEPYAAMKAALGENPKAVYGEQKKAPMTRMASAALLRQALVDAQEYIRKRDSDSDDFERDLGLEALAEVVEGQKPLKIHAHRADDILTAIRVAREFGLRFTLDHCTEGHLILPQLARAGAPVLLGPTLLCRTKVELKNQSAAAPRLLHEAGVPFALVTDHPEFPLKYLLLEAAVAVREGLPERAALAAVTTSPARIAGLNARLGALAPGLDADIALYEGDPLDGRTKVKCVLADGEMILE